MTESATEFILDEGTRDGWDDDRARTYANDLEIDTQHPDLRRSVDTLLAHSSPAASAAPSPLDSFSDLCDAASSSSDSEGSEGPRRVRSEATCSEGSRRDPERARPEGTNCVASSSSDVASSSSSDDADDDADDDDDAVDDASSLSDALVSDPVSDPSSFDPPTPCRPAALRPAKRRRAPVARPAKRRLIFTDADDAPTYFLFQLGDQRNAFDAPSPIDFFVRPSALHHSPIERVLLSRLIFYTAARPGRAGWERFQTDASIYLDADFVSWFLAPSYPLLLLCAVHVACRGSIAPEVALEASPRGALLRSLLARLALFERLRDVYRARYATAPPALRAHLLGQPCRFAPACHESGSYHRLVCTAEDCVMAAYRARFLAANPDGLLPNAAELARMKKSPRAFPDTGFVPFSSPDIERHWRRDLPPLDRDAFLHSLAVRSSTHGVYAPPPRIFFQPDDAGGAFFAIFPPSQAVFDGTILGAVRLPFPGLGGTAANARCGALDRGSLECLHVVCERARLAGTSLLSGPATYPALRAAGITSPLLAPRDRVAWLIAARALVRDAEPALVRDLYPLSDAAFAAAIQATTVRPSAATAPPPPPPPSPTPAH